MNPAHYTLTELLIIAASIFSINRLYKNNYYFALFGILFIGIAAAVGAIRFGLLNTEFIIQLNKILALYVGVLCLSLIATQIVFNLNFKNLGWFIFVLSILSIASGLIWPKILLIKLIYFWSTLSIILVFFIPDKKTWKKILKSILMSILLISFLTVSKRGLLATNLGSDLSFHLYHTLIALWVVSINSIIKENNTN